MNRTVAAAAAFVALALLAGACVDPSAMSPLEEHTGAIGGALPTINEIRVEQTGTDDDEYVEIAGAPGAALTGLALVVIGDDGTGGSGTIEAVVDLSALTLPADGILVIAEPTFTLGTVDFTAPGANGLNFENSDNFTFLLVTGFSGADGDDLDTDDDGTLETEPWTGLADLVALVEEPNPPVATEYHYGPPAICTASMTCASVGPDGTFVPGHLYRCADGAGAWRIGNFTLGVDDTPGGANACAVCGDGATDGSEQCDDGAANGTLASCCSATCSFNAPGTACDDGLPCTTAQTCNATGACTSAVNSCDDGNACTIDTCDALSGACANPPLVCDDANVCNGVETCDVATGCVPGTAPICGDADACNGTEACDPIAGCLPGVPPVCDDTNPCNGVEACVSPGGCVPGVALVCDDLDPCTADSCDSVAGCVASGTCADSGTDSAAPGTDSATPPSDSGAPGTDAMASSDAAPGTDALPGADAGVPPPRGGCRCEVATSATTSAPVSWAPALGLGLALLLRLRRRGR